jgi:hypothetical protein
MNVKIRRHGGVLGDVSVWAMVKLEDGKEEEHWELQYQQLPDRSFQEGWKSWCIKVITIPAKIKQSVAKIRYVKMIVRVLPRHVLQYLGPRPAGCTCRLLGGSKTTPNPPRCRLGA